MKKFIYPDAVCKSIPRSEKIFSKNSSTYGEGQGDKEGGIIKSITFFEYFCATPRV